MPEVVQTLAGKPGLVRYALHVPRDVLRMQLRPVLAGEDETALDIGLTPLEPFRLLAQLVEQESANGAGAQLEAPMLTAGRLRTRDLRPVPELDDLLHDGDFSPDEVDVLPAQADGLPTPKPGEGQQLVQGRQPIRGRRVQEPAELLRAPRAHFRARNIGQVHVQRGVNGDPLLLVSHRQR